MTWYREIWATDQGSSNAITPSDSWKQCILLNGQISKTHSLSDGLPQGYVLAPSLFHIDISDLPDTILCKFIYANHITLAAQGKDLTTVGDILSTHL